MTFAVWWGFMAFYTGPGHLHELVGHCNSRLLASSLLPQFCLYSHCGIWTGLVSIWVVAFPTGRGLFIPLALAPWVSLMGNSCQVLLIEPPADLRPWTNLPNGQSVAPHCWKWAGEIWSPCYCDRSWTLECHSIRFLLISAVMVRVVWWPAFQLPKLQATRHLEFCQSASYKIGASFSFLFQKLGGF